MTELIEGESYDPHFKVNKSGIFADYITVWNSHWTAYENIRADTAKRKQLSPIDLNIIKTSIEKYEEYLWRKYPLKARQILRESNSENVTKINALVQLFNKELAKGQATREKFLKYYAAIKALIKGC